MKKETSTRLQKEEIANQHTHGDPSDPHPGTGQNPEDEGSSNGEEYNEEGGEGNNEKHCSKL
jgi:hypothetical protein